MAAYCWAGRYIAGELMRAEGFTDVRYVEGDSKASTNRSGSHAARRIFA